MYLEIISYFKIHAFKLVGTFSRPHDKAMELLVYSHAIFLFTSKLCVVLHDNIALNVS